MPLLKEIRKRTFGHVKTVCSLRDVLVEKRDPVEYEQRVLDNLNRYFDLLLIHSDANFIPLEKTFSRVNEISIPVHHTGFVTQKIDETGRKNIRDALKLAADEKLIVASAGGGRSGYRILSCVIDACRLLAPSRRIRLQVFTGPFLDDAAYQRLAAKAGPRIQIDRFTKDFLSYLQAADLSVSMAGYNTTMNLLTARVPALVWPYPHDREQGLRAGRLARLGALSVLTESDLNPAALSRLMDDRLREPPPPAAGIDQDGAFNTAKFLKNWRQNTSLNF
jgi:predicted glycosyltransferase